MRNRNRTGDKAPTLKGLVIAIDKESYASGEGWDRAPGIAIGGPCATLQTSGTPHAVCYVQEQYLFENHSQDTRYKGPLDEAPTVNATYGMGGNNQPFVVEPTPFCKSARAQTKDDATTWKPGEVANTLNTFDQGEARANELVVQGEPVYCLQGSMIGRDDKNGPQGSGINEGVAFTQNATDRPAVVYAFDRAAFNQGQNAQYNFEITDSGVNSTLVAKGPSGVAYVDTTHADDVARIDDVTAPLQARDFKGGKLVQVQYIVRRLTPTECARLQGFADWWSFVEKKDSLTDEEYQFWLEVRNTHAAINGKKVQDYTEKQMLTWYNKLYTDSAEYKMWGNGIALPPALYCLQGIVDALNKPEEDDDSWMM